MPRAVGFVFGKGLDALGVPILLSVPAAAAVFVGLLWSVLKYTENQTYLLYLLCDTIWTWQFSHRQRPEWDERIDRFAEYLVKVVRSSDAEEILVVGHSSGSFLGTEILARALQIDPALGRHGPRVVLLTIGGNFPIVGFHKASQRLSRSSAAARGRARDRLDRLPVAQGRDELLPVRSACRAWHRRRPSRRNPTIVPVRFREIIKPENYGLFRWQFFRVHFQFVMANERPHAYDFFMIVCGPIPVRERMADPEAALALATAEDAAAREKAWTRLESARPAAQTDGRAGDVEPPARLSG